MQMIIICAAGDRKSGGRVDGWTGGRWTGGPVDQERPECPARYRSAATSPSPFRAVIV